MKRYGNKSGNSGVTAYDVGSDYIDVQFGDERIYRYSFAKAGKLHVEKMKELAKTGKGLTTYISQHVHNLFD